MEVPPISSSATLFEGPADFKSHHFWRSHHFRGPADFKSPQFRGPAIPEVWPSLEVWPSPRSGHHPRYGRHPTRGLAITQPLVCPSPDLKSVHCLTHDLSIAQPRTLHLPTRTWTSSRMVRRSHHLQNMDPDEHLALPAPPPSDRGAAATSPTSLSAAGAGVPFLAPVVLRVLPLRGSLAPAGYIYDSTPDAEGGSWLQCCCFSPTRAIRSFTTPARISIPNAGPWVWSCRSSLLIICRTTSFLLGVNFSWLRKLPTCRGHVAPTAKCRHIWPKCLCRGDTILIPTGFFVSGFADIHQIFLYSTKGTYGEFLCKF